MAGRKRRRLKCLPWAKTEKAKLTNEKENEPDEQQMGRELPTELLESIILRLTLIDNIRASAVCKQWLAVATSVRVVNKPPWLMFSPKSGDLVEFYDPMQRKSHWLELPELSGSTICYSKDGWLLVYKPRIQCLMFIEPYTRQSIKLPKFQVAYQVVAFSAAPTSASCIVFTVKHISPTIIAVSTCRPGATQWTTVNFRNRLPFVSSIWNKLVFSNGVFYCLSLTGWLGVYDPKKRTWSIHVMPPPKCPETFFAKNWWKSKFMAENNGEIFVVYTSAEFNPVVYQLDQTNKQWVEIKSLGGLTFFASFLSSQAKADLLGDMRNSVYFSKVRFFGKRCITYSLQGPRSLHPNSNSPHTSTTTPGPTGFFTSPVLNQPDKGGENEREEAKPLMQSQGGGEEEITEEQRKRAEANRLAALAKRKAIVNDNPNGFKNAYELFKCRKLSSVHTKAALPKPINQFPKCGLATKPEMPPPVTEKFRVRLEICSPDSFSVTPLPAPGIPYPGDEVCLEKLSDWLSNIIPSHYTQNNGGGRSCVFKLGEYDMVLRSLKNCEGIKYEEIPWGTFNVVEKMSHSYAAGKWIPCRPEHLSDDKVDELIQNLPKIMLDALLPFQIEGVRFGLRRGGRCLIADEMGLGKTLQAIAIACCFINEGPILIVCPAILRYSWAEELERWLPLCLPSDIHLVFGHQDNPIHLAKCPRIVVISYKMLEHLERSMLEREWATLILDESHHLRCSKKRTEPKEVKSVLNAAVKVKHLLLLSGTPSLSRPFDIFHQINMLWSGLLGKTKYEFANTYCSVNFRKDSQGKQFQDFSNGVRLEELNILLKQTVMIRRLKKHVMGELPPIRRKIIRLEIKKSDLASAKAALGVVDGNAPVTDDSEDEFDLSADKSQDKNDNCESIQKLDDQVLGLAKIPGFLEWLSIHPIISELNCDEAPEGSFSSHKMIIFGHHHKVLDRIEKFIREKGIECIRIDGNNPNPIDRQNAVRDFQSSRKVKIALVGILAGGCGLNLTAAEDVVFVELPKENANLDQAESRAHRLGQTKAVNVYIFCAKDTNDESRWQVFNHRLFQVSSTINGKYGAIPEIKVEAVSCLETTLRADERNDKLAAEREANTEVSAVSLVLSQSQEKLYVQEYHGSHETEDKSNGSQEETDTLSSQVQSLQVELPSLPYGGSSPEATQRAAGRISSQNLEVTEGNINKVNMVDETDPNAGEIIDPNKVATRSSMLVTSLRFEVSKYTGRVHLYSCIPEIDSRPRPLFHSFRPEEIESEGHEIKMDNNCNEDYRSAVLTFLEQWKQLRPIQQKRLKAKPLQLPLSTELCYLEESHNHQKGGLLKGGSKRRSTPLNEISHPLPPNATWRNVNLFRAYGKKEKIYKQGWSTMGEPLCKLCQNPCKNDNAKKPEFFEDLFCNLGCYEEYRLRTRNRSLREGLFEIERGVCTNCQLDCHKLVEHLKPLSYEKREEYIKRVAPKLAMRKKQFDKLVQEPAEGNAWHADHLVPVYQGGGECRLENMRTLCVTCHADVTAAQCAERRLAREMAKRQLKALMKNLKDAEESGEINGNIQDHEQFDNQEKMEEDLFVEVPGSAYSIGKPIITTRSPDQEPPSSIS